MRALLARLLSDAFLCHNKCGGTSEKYRETLNCGSMVPLHEVISYTTIEIKIKHFIQVAMQLRRQRLHFGNPFCKIIPFISTFESLHLLARSRDVLMKHEFFKFLWF